MSEHQQPRFSSDIKKTHDRQDFAKPKIHFIPQKPAIHASNWASTDTNDCKPEKKNFRYYLRHCKQRKMSVTMHCLALGIMSVMVAMETAVYRRQPTETSLEDDMYPVQNIDFPAVSICNLNVISRKAAMKYAEILWLEKSVREIPDVTLEKVKHVLKYLALLYKFEDKHSHPGDLALLHEILEKALGKKYKLSKVMEYLAPPCHDFFVTCFWQGKYRQCNELFVPRWTPDGYCCSFNQVRWNNGFSGDGEKSFTMTPERFVVAGSDYGLLVILRPQLEDYYQTILPGRGFKVLLYTASDYPDSPSGGLREVLLGPGTEAFVNVDAALFYSSKEIMKYRKEERKCLFNVERREIYGGTYSFSQCIMLCRVEDISRHCDCIPFFYPVSKSLDGVRQCNVKDLGCLARHKYKWWSVEPLRNVFADPSNIKSYRKSGESLKCDCFASCENVHYTTYTTSATISTFRIALLNCNNETLGPDHSALHVSYSGIGALRLKRDATYHWYDLLSKYGGLCGLCLGISILTPIEILYLIWMRLCQRRKNKNVTPVERLAAWEKIKSHERPIYWNEFGPFKPFKSRISSAISSVFHRQ